MSIMSTNTSTHWTTRPHVQQQLQIPDNKSTLPTTHPHVQQEVQIPNNTSTRPWGSSLCALCCSSADLWWWWWVSFYLFLINQHLISFSWGCSVCPSPNRVLKWSCPFSTWGAMSCLLGGFLDPPLDNTCPTSVQVPKYRVKPLSYISV